MIFEVTGGNVNGVYLLMKKEVLLSDVAPEPSSEIEEYVTVHFAGDLLMELGLVSSDEE
jgi:hypothetical protein